MMNISTKQAALAVVATVCVVVAASALYGRHVTLGRKMALEAKAQLLEFEAISRTKVRFANGIPKHDFSAFIPAELLQQAFQKVKDWEYSPEKFPEMVVRITHAELETRDCVILVHLVLEAKAGDAYLTIHGLGVGSFTSGGKSELQAEFTLQEVIPEFRWWNFAMPKNHVLSGLAGTSLAEAVNPKLKLAIPLTGSDAIEIPEMEQHFTITTPGDGSVTLKVTSPAMRIPYSLTASEPIVTSEGLYAYGQIQ